MFFNVNAHAVEYVSQMQYPTITECAAAEKAMAGGIVFNKEKQPVLIETSCYGESGPPPATEKEVPRTSH